jgi:hypothetical protein
MPQTTQMALGVKHILLEDIVAQYEILLYDNHQAEGVTL